MDLSDGIITDCFSFFTAIDQDSKPSGSGANIKAKLKVRDGNEKKEICIFDITRVGLALISKWYCFGSHAFAVGATDGITTQKARQIRPHKLLKANGFKEAQIKELTRQETEWKQTFDRLKEVALVQSWEPLIAVLYSAEVEEVTADTERLYCQQINPEEDDYPRRHFTDSKVCFAVAETEELLTERTDHYGNNARVFTLTGKVINRWTTLPLPTTDTWIKAIKQEPDLKLIKSALQNKTIPLKTLFTNKKYHNELTSQRLCLENGMIYQLEEQPMATRIRQLQRKVVPSTLQPTILAAYHATSLAGHTGVYKTYWHIAARFWWPEMSRDIRKAVLEYAHCRELLMRQAIKHNRSLEH